MPLLTAVNPVTGNVTSLVGVPTLLSNQGNGTLDSFTITRTVSAGNDLVLRITSGSSAGAGLFTVSDNLNPSGGQWGHTAPQDLVSYYADAVFVLYGTAGGSITITIVPAYAPESLCARLWELKNLGSLDLQTSVSTGTSTTPNLTLPTLTGNGEFSMVCAINQNALTGFSGAGWTDEATAAMYGVAGVSPTAYQIASSEMTSEAQWTIASRQWWTYGLAWLNNKIVVNQPKIVLSGGVAQLEFNGTPLVFKGVTLWALPDHISNAGGTGGVGGSGFASQLYANLSTVLETLVSWDVNIVRLRTLATDYFLGASGPTGLTEAQYIGQIVSIYNACAANGIYMMVCDWMPADSTGNNGTTNYSGANWAGNASVAFPLFAAILQALPNAQYLIFEPFNEPTNAISWAQWQTNMEATLAELRTTLGYTGLVVLDPISWANSGTGGAGYSATYYGNLTAYDAGLIGSANLAFSKHDYANEYSGSTWSDANWQAAVGGAQTLYPIFENEIGNYNGSGTTSLPWSQAAITDLVTKHSTMANYCGTLAFNGGPWVDANALTTGYTTPTTWGGYVETAYTGGGGGTAPGNPHAPINYGAVAWTSDFRNSVLPANWAPEPTAGNNGLNGGGCNYGFYTSANGPGGQACIYLYCPNGGSNGNGAQLNADPTEGGGSGCPFNVGMYTEALIYCNGPNGNANNDCNGWVTWWTTTGGNYNAEGEMDIVENFNAGPSSNYHPSSGNATNGPEGGSLPSVLQNMCNQWFVAGCLRLGNENYIWWTPVGGTPTQSTANQQPVATNDNGGTEYPYLTQAPTNNGNSNGGVTTYGPAGAFCCAWIRAWDNCSL